MPLITRLRCLLWGFNEIISVRQLALTPVYIRCCVSVLFAGELGGGSAVGSVGAVHGSVHLYSAPRVRILMPQAESCGFGKPSG